MRVESGLHRFEQQRIEHLRREIQLATVFSRSPFRRFLGAGVVQVRGQHGPGIGRCVDDAVHEQFDVAHAHARRDLGFALIVGGGQCLGFGDGLGRVGSGGGRVEFDRQYGAGRQLARLLQRGERLAILRPRQGIEETGDALLAHGVERGAALDQLLGIGRRRHHGGHGIRRAVLADAGGVAGTVARVLAVGGVDRVLVDAGHCQTTGVGQHGVEVGGTYLNRPFGVERIKGRFVGIAVEAGHAHAIPTADFKPHVLAFVLVGIQARLNGFLKILTRHRLVFQVAQGHGPTAIAGMHVRIDEARHQHASGQIDHLRLCTDE
ncbi:hypothetical protein D3C71_907110 [compost metagenome]